MNLTKDNLHHAYIVEGNKGEIFSNICKFCEEDLDFAIRANPDFVYEEYDKLKVSEARRLREIQMNKTTSRGRKIYVIAFNFITKEAQNSLLKVLEEPTEGTHFFFITPSAHIFLPTVLSRVLVMTHKTEIEEKATNFFKKDLKTRIDVAVKMTGQIKKEELSKADAISFAQTVLKDKYKELKKKKDHKELKKLREVEKIIDYLHDGSSSVKTLLEYLAIVV